MPQSSVIFFFIAAAFLVFITQRGELRTYLGFLYGTAPAPASSSTGSANPSGGATLNLGPLGTINLNPLVPGGAASNFLKGIFGGGGAQ